VSDAETSELERVDVCAAIVSYRNASEVLESLAAARPQVDRVLIVDNGSGDSVTKRFEEVQQKGQCDFICNEENLGIAAALNQALEWAGRRKYSWLLTLDQDCLLPEGFVDKMVAALSGLKQGKARVAVIGPISGTDVKPVLPLDHPQATEVATLMTGGSLVNVAVACSLGGFDAPLFVDYVDHEFCFRCRRNGYVVLRVNDLFLEHTPGKPTSHRLPWKRVQVSNHEPLRYYYITRNGIIIWRRYWSSNTRWVVRDMWNAFKGWILILLFERTPGKTTQMMLRGLHDALRGLSGRYAGRQP
jgi:rhamnosyltransferase